jgi:hypothetical protein
MTLKEEFYKKFVYKADGDCGLGEIHPLYVYNPHKIWAWVAKKAGDEGTRLYNLGKEVGYDKAIDNAISYFIEELHEMEIASSKYNNIAEIKKEAIKNLKERK